MQRGDGKSYGLKTGLTRGQFVVALFEDQLLSKSSDEELAETLRKEFRNSGVAYENYMIRLYRNKYNRGEHACQAGPPKIQVPRYVAGKATRSGAFPGPNPRPYWQEKETRKEAE